MKTTILTCFTMVVLLHRTVVAQSTAGGEPTRVVSGNGTVVVKELPTTMQVSIQFKEAGKDLPDALKNLKDRLAATRSQFVKLGANKDSIREGAPAVAGDDPSARQSARQMAMMMAARGGGPKKKKSAAAAKVHVTGTMTADWPLPKGEVEDLLLFVQPLKDKINELDLGGQKDRKKISAEEQEELEEMELMQQQFGDSNGTMKPGEPRFLFLSKISAEEQAKSRAAAFQKARQQAEQLAVASGHKLGKLHSLQSSAETSGVYDMYRSMRFNQDGQPADDETPELDDGVVQSPVCAKIRHIVVITAAFDID